MGKKKNSCEINAEFDGTEDKVFYTTSIIKARKLWRANYINIIGKAKTIAWFFNTDPLIRFSSDGSGSIENNFLSNFKLLPADNNGSESYSWNIWLSTVNFAESFSFTQFHLFRNQLRKHLHLYKDVLPRPKHCLFDLRY